MSRGPERPNPATDDAAGTEPAASDVPDLEERVVSTTVLHRGRYLEFRHVAIERADGSRSERDIVWHPGAVAIVALDEAERVLLVRQFRLAAGGTLLELPAGTLDLDEHLELTRLPWREAVAAVDGGEIRDAKSIVGLLQLARRMG